MLGSISGCCISRHIPWIFFFLTFQATIYDKGKADNGEFPLLHKLVDLVDKYWNGSKSLHTHSKFKGTYVFEKRHFKVKGIDNVFPIEIPTLRMPEKAKRCDFYV